MLRKERGFEEIAVLKQDTKSCWKGIAREYDSFPLSHTHWKSNQNRKNEGSCSGQRISAFLPPASPLLFMVENPAITKIAL